MSKLGFDIAIKNLRASKRRMLKETMDVAQKTFDRNFETESVDGRAWDDVVRDVPPPILDVTGEMRGNVVAKGNVQIAGDSATLTVDPVDRYGRGYASYHQEGTPNMPRREYMKQTNELTMRQEQIIMDIVDQSV